MGNRPQPGAGFYNINSITGGMEKSRRKEAPAPGVMASGAGVWWMVQAAQIITGSHR